MHARAEREREIITNIFYVMLFMLFKYSYQLVVINVSNK